MRTSCGNGWMLGRGLVVLGVVLRLLFVAHPSSTVFDEVHYVRFIGRYLKQETVVDVHPPLGRLLFYGLTRVALASGTDRVAAGESLADFQVGQTFAGTALEPIYPMLRLSSCLASLLLAYTGYRTFLALEIPANTATILTGLFLFDSAMHSMFRLIMIDSYVLLCCAVVLLSLLEMNRLRHRTPSTRRAVTRQHRHPQAASPPLAPPTLPINILVDKDIRSAVKVEVRPEVKTGSSAATKSTIPLTDTLPTNPLSTPLTDSPSLAASFTPLGPHYRRSLQWAALLGVALGVGVSLKWSVLPMGGPIAIFLLVDLASSLRLRQRHPFRWLLPCLQGALILLLSFTIYLTVFLVNFQVQNQYTPSVARWFSFEYHASLANSPLAELAVAPLTDQSRVVLGLPAHRGFLAVGTDGQLAVTPLFSAAGTWQLQLPDWVDSHSLSAPVQFGQGVYLQHDSGVFLSSADTLVADQPSLLLLSPLAANSAVAIANQRQEYLTISPTHEATWSATPVPFQLFSPASILTNSILANEPPTSQLSTTVVHSQTVSASSAWSKFVEANQVMFRSFSFLSSTHQYVSHPLQWLAPFRYIHLWNGGTSETAPASANYGAAAQIFFTFNPVLLGSSLLALVLALAYFSTTKTQHATSYLVLLVAYLANYLPYCCLTRDTYLHHYLPSYYSSLVLLGYLLSATPKLAHLVVASSLLCYLVHYPLLVGAPATHELCTLLTNRQSILCQSMDSLNSLASLFD